MRMQQLSLALGLLLAAAAPLSAAEHDPMAMEHSDHAMAPAPIAAEGKVNAIDLEGGTVNLTHGPIPALHWPPMTMEFKLQSKEVASGIQAGDKVRFEMVQSGPTDYVVTKMTTAK